MNQPRICQYGVINLVNKFQWRSWHLSQSMSPLKLIARGSDHIGPSVSELVQAKGSLPGRPV